MASPGAALPQSGATHDVRPVFPYRPMEARRLRNVIKCKFLGRRGLVIAPGLLHVGGHGQASPSPQTATLPKSSEEIERCVIASLRVAESMGFKGDFRQWGHTLRIGN